MIVVVLVQRTLTSCSLCKWISGSKTNWIVRWNSTNFKHLFPFFFLFFFSNVFFSVVMSEVEWFFALTLRISRHFFLTAINLMSQEYKITKIRNVKKHKVNVFCTPTCDNLYPVCIWFWRFTCIKNHNLREKSHLQSRKSIGDRPYKQGSPVDFLERKCDFW